MATVKVMVNSDGQVVEVANMPLGLTIEVVEQESKHVTRTFSYDPETFTCLLDAWHLEDVTGQDETITEDQAREVLSNLHRNHSAELGINWHAIDYWIDIAK